MAKFTDEQGHEWHLRLNVGLIERARHSLEIDLADMSSQTFFKLADDPVAMVGVLWLLVESEAKERGVSPESFGEALVGDAIDAATEALLEAIGDFFPRRKRELFHKMTEAGNASLAEADRLAEESLADPETRQRIARAMKADRDRALDEALSRWESATSSPGSSESTPGPSASAS